jgi:hypothetical protein
MPPATCRERPPAAGQELLDQGFVGRAGGAALANPQRTRHAERFRTSYLTPLPVPIKRDDPEFARTFTASQDDRGPLRATPILNPERGASRERARTLAGIVPSSAPTWRVGESSGTLAATPRALAASPVRPQRPRPRPTAGRDPRAPHSWRHHDLGEQLKLDRLRVGSWHRLSQRVGTAGDHGVVDLEGSCGVPDPLRVSAAADDPAQQSSRVVRHGSIIQAKEGHARDLPRLLRSRRPSPTSDDGEDRLALGVF